MSGFIVPAAFATLVAYRRRSSGAAFGAGALAFLTLQLTLG